jgi:hypothetical protein
MASDHFQPDATMDPHEQRRTKAYLEQIDRATFEANRQVLARDVGRVDLENFKRLAENASIARAEWVAVALELSSRVHIPTPEETARLAHLRAAYEELSQAYDAIRRMVERGYLCYLSHSR